MLRGAVNRLYTYGMRSGRAALAAEMRRRRLRQVDAAMEIGISRCELWQVLSGYRRASRTIAALIEQWCPEIRCELWLTQDERRRLSRAKRAA